MQQRPGREANIPLHTHTPPPPPSHHPIPSHQDPTAAVGCAQDDGDGLADAVDPGCASLEDDNEHDTTPPSNFDFKLGSDAYGGAYLLQLSWKGKPVVRDGGKSRTARRSS
jgi:hypothetical protein